MQAWLKFYRNLRRLLSLLLALYFVNLYGLPVMSNTRERAKKAAELSLSLHVRYSPPGCERLVATRLGNITTSKAVSEILLIYYNLYNFVTGWPSYSAMEAKEWDRSCEEGFKFGDMIFVRVHMYSKNTRWFGICASSDCNKIGNKNKFACENVDCQAKYCVFCLCFGTLSEKNMRLELGNLLWIDLTGRTTPSVYSCSLIHRSHNASAAPMASPVICGSSSLCCKAFVMSSDTVGLFALTLSSLPLELAMALVCYRHLHCICAVPIMSLRPLVIDEDISHLRITWRIRCGGNCDRVGEGWGDAMQEVSVGGG